MKRAIMGTILLNLMGGPVFSQPTNPPPAFEVASVKPGTEAGPVDMGGGRFMAQGGCSGGPGTSDPGLLTCQNITLANLVTTAYNLKRYQTANSYPAWMENAHFNISAKIPPGATREDLRLMEQDLLAKRFKLAVHFDKKEMQIFELTVGKNGAKLKESPPAPEKTADANPATPPDFTKLQHDKDGFPVLPRRIGGMSMLMSPMTGAIRIQANDETMEQLASILTNQLGKPVTDLTEIKGTYDITLTCSRESMGMRATGATDAAAPDPDVEPVPTLMEAVQQQLGLKLEQKKGTVDVLVIDHSEKSPIEN